MEMPKKVVEKLVYDDMRLTSVVPGIISGENKTYELKGIDLAMKLHYLSGLYIFKNTNIIGNNGSNNGGRNESFMSFDEVKAKPMYDLLVSYFMACGRIRLSEEADARPTIKLNDAGIRVIEAHSNKTVDELLAMEDFLELQDQLVYNHALGPDLPFSPLVCLQVTWFKCGGISMGLNWSHVLGDAFAASEFMNMWSQYLQGHYEHPQILSLEDPPKPIYPPLNPAQKPTSLKRVNPMGNHWVPPPNSKISTHSFRLTPKQLGELHVKVHGSDNITRQYFEIITAILWSSIAKMRKDLDTQIVTICRPNKIKRRQEVPYNGQVLGTIEAGFSVSSVEPLQLVHVINNNVVDESGAIEELVKKEMGEFDFIVYGTNLTFIDMEEVDVYGFKLKGNSPAFASYTVGGIQDKGAVIVLPGPIDGEDAENNESKLVVLLLPENELEFLKIELKKEWCIA